MSSSGEFVGPSQAARRLGVSVKTLRIYERHGLVRPLRTSAGWRAYGPRDMAAMRLVVELRALGLGLAQIAATMRAGPAALEPLLAAHQRVLESRFRALAETAGRVRRRRADLAGHDPDGFPRRRQRAAIAFDLPWPWGGERFELVGPASITFITGPLGSGKTRLARAIAENLPGAVFAGLERRQGRAAGVVPPALAAAPTSPALRALVAALEIDGPVVVDMVEEGLDDAAQRAVMAWLRQRTSSAPPLFLLTRSSAILDLADVRSWERILYCPANHAPPIEVAPCPGAAGFDALATCLATPEVRARTAGVVAIRSEVA